MTNQQKLRTLLFAGVSTVALAVAVPELRAADLGPPPAAIYKAPATLSPIVTMLIEGGVLWTGGRGGFIEVPFFDAAAPNVRPGIGWTGAVGIDYQWAGSPWHLNLGFRYGQSKEKKATFFSTSPTATGAYALREEHWVADFMVGRDLGIGLGKSQIKFGLRIADLSHTADSTGVYSSSANAIRARSTFFGIGPRVALEGSVPLGGAWNFDYGVGAAALFGTRKYSQDEINEIEHERATRGGAVFNADVSGAFAYWLTPHFKLAVGYQFDGYWKGLLVDVSDDNRQTVNRFYHGPVIRATGKF